MSLGYDSRPRNWYEKSETEQSEEEVEEVLQELIPSGDRQVFKSHLKRGLSNSNRPYEVVVERRGKDDFFRAVYSREVDDMSTADVSLQELRGMEYSVEVAEGSEYGGAHRTDTMGFDGLPEEVQTIFKGHDDYQWI